MVELVNKIRNINNRNADLSLFNLVLYTLLSVEDLTKHMPSWSLILLNVVGVIVNALQVYWLIKILIDKRIYEPEFTKLEKDTYDHRFQIKHLKKYRSYIWHSSIFTVICLISHSLTLLGSIASVFQFAFKFNMLSGINCWSTITTIFTAIEAVTTRMYNVLTDRIKDYLISLNN